MNKENHIKRPMNSFMVWSKIERRNILQMHPEMSNPAISTQLGEKWRNLSPEEQAPFKAEAKRLKEVHMMMHPEYKYKPEKKNKRKPMKSHDQSASIAQEAVSPSLPTSSTSNHLANVPNMSVPVGMAYTMSPFVQPMEGFQHVPQFTPQQTYYAGRCQPLTEPMHQQMPSYNEGTTGFNHTFHYQPYPETINQMANLSPPQAPLASLPVWHQFNSSISSTAYKQVELQPHAGSFGYGQCDASINNQTTSSTTSADSSPVSSEFLFDEFSDITPSVKSLPFYQDCPWDELYNSLF